MASKKSKKEETDLEKEAESQANEVLRKTAEAESTTEEKTLEKKKNKVLATLSEDIERKKKELLKRAKKLKEKITEEEIKTEELKEKVKIKKKEEMLVPLEEYVKSGIYIGTRVVTPGMRPFVYRRRADGLAIFNTDLIDEKLKEGIKFLSQFSPEDTILICKRQAGWRAVEKFSDLTGIKVFTKKYPAGIITNKALPDFFENELTIITDQWVDKNALNDTLKVHKKVLMICDTNNFPKGADQVIIGNNKSEKSLGVIFYLLAKGYCEARGINSNKKIPELSWWTEEEKEVTNYSNGDNIKKKTKPLLAEASAEFGV